MKPSAHLAAAQRASAPATPPQEPRRGFLLGILAVIVGGIVSLFPVVAGGIVFLDPVLRRKQAKPGGNDPQADRPFLRVASRDSVPDNGTPIQVPVISDLVDAWNRELNQPIGAVYLVRKGNDVTAFNAICPHAGCFVGYAADRKCFQCPCHTSSFEVDGARIMPSPSPRNMDTLAVDAEKLKAGEVWVQFRNFYPGKAEPEEKQ